MDLPLLARTSARVPADAYTPLRFMPGIGPAKAEAFKRIGLLTAWDVLHAVPRFIGPPPAIIEDGPIPLATAVRLRARVVSARPLFGRGHGMTLEATLERHDGYVCKARFFNAAYLRRHLIPQEWFLWEGRTDATHMALLLHPSFTHLSAGRDAMVPSEAPCRVAYSLTDGIGERLMDQIVLHCLTEHLSAIIDPLAEVDALTYQQFIRTLHQPTDAHDHEHARRQLARRELTALAWHLQARRARIVGASGRAWRWTEDTHARALARLPFTLTPGQSDALAAIRSDLREPAPMFRLLHGDVGSGKTAVALIASLAVIADGAQVVWFAPTAILAHQHRAFVQRCLIDSRVRVGFLTGNSSASERATLLADVASGQCQLIIGTHALLHEDIGCPELGLVVIDEQHKFGVEQRAALINRAEQRQQWKPDLLVMTATPIPRTLALTVFGDLAVTRIEGRPPGRAVVTTQLATLDDTLIDNAIDAALAKQG